MRVKMNKESLKHSSRSAYNIAKPKIVDCREWITNKASVSSKISSGNSAISDGIGFLQVS
jgi:hypothetical protein